MPPGSPLEFRLDAEFFANASGLQWEHATSVVLPNGTVIVRPEQLHPPGLLGVTLAPLLDSTLAISACATLDLGTSQQQVGGMEWNAEETGRREVLLSVPCTASIR
jgi:hypothetical protein